MGYQGRAPANETTGTPAAGSLPSDSFSTNSVRREDQYEAWAEWFRPIFEIIPNQPIRNGFVARNQVWKFGGLAVSKVAAPAVRVERQAANLRRDPVDHWVITFCRRGATMMTVGGVSFEAAAGVPFIWTLGEPSVTRRTEVERVQLFLKRDAFRDIAPVLDRARGPATNAALARLLGDYIVALERAVPDLTSGDAPRLANAVGAMVAAAFEPSLGRLGAAASQIDVGRRERVRQTVRKSLRSPSLGPATLCRAVGISRSQLYRMMQGEGGIAHYIQCQRLMEAHALLSRTEGARAISTIAEELCFADPSTFSRAFKREFGYSPSDVRSAAPMGIGPSAFACGRSRHDASVFGDLMRGF